MVHIDPVEDLRGQGAGGKEQRERPHVAYGSYLSPKVPYLIGEKKREKREAKSNSQTNNCLHVRTCMYVL